MFLRAKYANQTHYPTLYYVASANEAFCEGDMSTDRLTNGHVQAQCNKMFNKIG